MSPISVTWRLYPESKIGFFVQKLNMFNFLDTCMHFQWE